MCGKKIHALSSQPEERKFFSKEMPRLALFRKIRNQNFLFQLRIVIVEFTNELRFTLKIKKPKPERNEREIQLFVQS